MSAIPEPARDTPPTSITCQCDIRPIGAALGMLIMSPTGADGWESCPASAMPDGPFCVSCIDRHEEDHFYEARVRPHA